MGRDLFDSPVGMLEIVSNGQALIKIGLIVKGEYDLMEPKDKFLLPDEITTKTKEQLSLYFDGKIKNFDLPVKLVGNGFCLKVWENLSKIPYGKTITYGELAAMSGSPKAYRSAGSCVGKNPIPIVVPCHRVVAKNGLGGFALGLEVKRFLLDIEKNT